VVVATNRDLAAMVREGTFRSDLVFRISVVTLHVPAARERGDDLVLLARQILCDLVPIAGRRIEGFSAEALGAIQRYSWPGNVRELRNAIEHAMVLGEGARIEVGDLPSAVSAAAGQPSSLDEVSQVGLPANLAWLERRAIQAALCATRGNRSRAAALLGINRQTLYNKLAEFENGSSGRSSPRDTTANRSERRPSQD
jgi:DNA-binding NtrC family response regulator